MSTFYMSYSDGNDSTTNTPLGWWSIAYTSGNDNGSAEPIADELGTGGTSGSTANVTVVVTDSGAWNTGDAVGTVYWYGKSAAFQSETVTFAVGASMSIAADFTYCAWKTTNFGSTEARTAAGDIMRLAKSPDTVAVGANGTFTDAPATKPSSKTVTSSTNASPISILTSIDHGMVTGDCCYIYNHLTNTVANGAWVITKVDDTNFTLDNSTGIAAGTSGTVYQINNRCIKLSAAVTKSIDRGEVAWTAANGSTVTRDTSYYKEGDSSLKVVKSGPANDTLYAFKALSGATDFSAYQDVSFWLRVGTAVLANDWEICLCSDASGVTVVDTLPLPVFPDTGTWAPFNVATGGNLGNSIQSVAIYSGSSAASTSYLNIDNITAGTTDGLNLTSLISKNSASQGGSEGFLGMKNISDDGTVLTLDKGTTKKPSDDLTSRGGGYSGTTETVALYKRETTKTVPGASTGSIIQQLVKSGASGNNIEFQGGYDPATNLQDGETYFDGQNGNGRGIYLTAESYITCNYLNATRYSYGIQLLNRSTNNTFTCISNVNNNTNTGLWLENGSDNNTFPLILNANLSGSDGINIQGTTPAANNTFTSVVNAYGNGDSGIELQFAGNNRFVSLSNISNNGDAGLEFVSCNNNTVGSITASKNGTYGIRHRYSGGNITYNATTSGNPVGAGFVACDTTFVNWISTDTLTFSGNLYPRSNNYLFSQDHGGVAGVSYIFTDGGNIQSNTTDRHTASGICWEMNPTDDERNSENPIILQVAKVACVANKEISIKAWIKKSHATNIGAKLVIPGGQIAGIAADVTTTKANDTDYEELSCVATPTVAGVIRVEVWAYYIGSTTESVFVDDMDISQAT